MNILTQEELQNLSTPRDGWCISIYMPTVEKGEQIRQNPILFKNLLDQAQDMLKETGMEGPEIAKFCEPLEVLRHDGNFWQHQDRTLAVFLSQDLFQSYRLPIEVRSQVAVNHRFYLKPIIPLLHEEEKVYVLALSQKKVRLLEASEDEIKELEVPNLPQNLANDPGLDDPQEGFQWRIQTTIMGGNTGGGGRQAMFHGHNEGFDDKKEYILNYFRNIDKAVTSYLNKENKVPLIIAGVEYLKPIYEEANTYQNLSDDIIPGNPDGIKDQELRDEALKIVKPQFQASKAGFVDQYRMLSGRRDKRAVRDLAEVIKAAPYGRVDVLFVDKNAKKWGTFDENNAEVHFEDMPRPENQDLLDYAAIQTILNGGTVLVVDSQEMPDPSSPVEAILRY